MIEEELPVFGLNIASILGLDTPFGIKDLSLKLANEDEMWDRLSNQVVPVIEELGLQATLKVKRIHITVSIVAPHQTAEEITFSASRRDATFFVRFTAHWNDLPKGDDEAAFRYFLGVSVKVLVNICKKYNLKSKKLSTLQASIRVPDSIPNTSVIEDANDEVRLHLKLGNDWLSSDSDLAANALLAEQLSLALEIDLLGNFDCSEVGDGFETVIFVGPNGTRIFEKILQVCKERVPKGSYVEILSQGRTEKKELPWL